MRLPFSTEALAEHSARHPWRVISIWLIALVASFAVIGALLSGALTTQAHLTNNPDAEKGKALLEQWQGETHDNEVVIVKSDSLTVDDAAFKAKVTDLTSRINGLGPTYVLNGRNFYDSNDATLVSQDKHTTLIQFTMAGDQEYSDKNIDKLLAITDNEADPQFTILNAGTSSLNDEIQGIAQTDLQKGEEIGIPIALIVLLLVFGALTAAVIPIVLGIFSILIAIGITAVVGQVFQFSFFVTNVITMIGLAVGIDYSLFIVSRYREERARGLDKYQAIHAAGSTASRAVFFSGMTVVFALMGMLLVPSTIFRSLGAGAVIVVIVSVMVSLTLLPAIIGLLGDRINSLRVPIVGRSIDKINYEHHGGFWDRITRTVMKYPVLSLVAALAVMLILAVPYLDLNTGSAGVRTLPPNTESYEAFTLLQSEFNFGVTSPAKIVISDSDVTAPQVQASVGKLKSDLADDHLYSPPTFSNSPDKSIGLLEVAINADPTSDTAIRAVRDLRDIKIPAAFAGSPAQVFVTGQTAGGIDYIDTTNAYTPIVFIFVLGLSFILLTIVFRSIVVPLKAIVMNLLSVGASYGLLVAVFQKGWGNEILGFQKVDVIEAWVPLWTFSILFGLSMDYHVFLLSRIRERFNKTDDNKESVAFGVRSTAGIITGAALIMASVFGGVALGDLVMFQQMGFGLAVAVLLDATIVRSVLVPAAMELLGRANWWLPDFLRWLPEVRTEAPEAPTTAPRPTSS
ncbi:MAG: MMPL family transporter [Chloroflexota bacterium]